MIDTRQRAALRRFAGARTKPELKELFALIRSHDDRALLAALAPPKPAKKPKRDLLLSDVELILKPLMARSQEKAELLVEHIAARKSGLAIEPRGLADAIKRLRAAKLKDGQIKAAAKALMDQLSKLYDGRETVV